MEIFKKDCCFLWLLTEYNKNHIDSLHQGSGTVTIMVHQSDDFFIFDNEMNNVPDFGKAYRVNWVGGSVSEDIKKKIDESVVVFSSINSKAEFIPLENLKTLENV